jgi:hypothetical protein
VPINPSNPEGMQESTAQQKKSAFRDPIVWATIGIFLATAASVGVGVLQWHTLDKTDKTLKAEQRPWVYFEPKFGFRTASDLTFDADGGHMQVIVDIVNTGHSPATYVQTTAIGMIWDKERTPLKEQRRLCDPFGSQPIDTSSGYTIFPGQNFPDQLIGIGFARADIDAQHARMKFITPAIIGCIFYVAAVDGSRHQSGFIFNVMRTPPFGLIDPDQGTISNNNLLLVISPLGSGRTD